MSGELTREPQRWSCSRCTETWTGLKPEHCPACHRTFGSTTAGDRHRTKDFHCQAPENVGLARDDAGIWRFPQTAANRERLDKLNAARRADASVISGPSSPGPIPEVPPADCEHDDATGEDQSWGPDMVWVCNGCGWRHRVVRDGHFSRMVAA